MPYRVNSALTDRVREWAPAFEVVYTPGEDNNLRFSDARQWHVAYLPLQTRDLVY